MDIKDLPKGAIPDPKDERDYKVEFLGAVNVNWNQEYRNTAPPGEDQDSSDDCVAESCSYYHWQLKKKKFSRKDLFCRIALNYGAYIRDGVKEIVDRGQATRDEVPDPEPQTPQNMRSSAGTSQDFREDDKELTYFALPQQDINGVAWGIQNYNGVVFGLQGDNYGWRDMLNPQPPSYGVSVWGHALYAMGFHMHNGQKCIIAKSSWCNSVKEHHIKENYFITGNTFSAWTLIPNPLTTKGMKLVKNTKDKTVGVYTGNQDNRIIALGDIESLGLFGDEPQFTMDFGTTPIYNIIKKNPNGQGFIIVNK